MLMILYSHLLISTRSFQRSIGHRALQRRPLSNADIVARAGKTVTVSSHPRDPNGSASFHDPAPGQIVSFERELDRAERAGDHGCFAIRDLRIVPRAEGHETARDLGSAGSLREPVG